MGAERTPDQNRDNQGEDDHFLVGAGPEGRERFQHAHQQQTCIRDRLYLALAAIGLPVLPGGRGGLGAFFGPTGGFLVGLSLIHICNAPIMAFSMVDLPAPLAPITVTMLPAGTVSVAPASAPTLP